MIRQPSVRRLPRAVVFIFEVVTAAVAAAIPPVAAILAAALLAVALVAPGPAVIAMAFCVAGAAAGVAWLLRTISCHAGRRGSTAPWPAMVGLAFASVVIYTMMEPDPARAGALFALAGAAACAGIVLGAALEATG